MNQMKQEGNKKLQDIYNARQLAKKISMNSVYGVLKLICAFIAASVTNRGRLMLHDVMNMMENMGHQVVYGDTDSVMVKERFGSEKEAFDYFTELEDKINKTLFSDASNVNSIEFEKYAVFFLLLGKKAYYMHMKESIGDPFKLTSTGTCDVRRDRPAILTDLTGLIGDVVSSLYQLPIQVTGKIVLDVVRIYLENLVDNKFPVSK